MTGAKEVRLFADHLVHAYADYDSMDGFSTIYLQDISDYDIEKFSSLILKNDPDIAAEATGSDNPAYDSKMLPALLSYLEDSTNKDKEIEFNTAWREGVSEYCHKIMEEILSESLNDYNLDRQTSIMDMRRY